MPRCSKFLALLLLLSPAIGFARGVPNGESPAFTPVPELTAGFDLLYEQKFTEARQIFANWESRNGEDPFGEVAVAASYLFEELYLQGVLTSEFFLNEKRFLHGIDGRPNPERMSHFGEALTRARELAKVRQKNNPQRWRSSFCSDAGRRNGIRRRIDSAEETYERLEAHEGSQQICRVFTGKLSGRDRCVHSSWNSKLHYWIAERWFPLRALVRWNSRR